MIPSVLPADITRGPLWLIERLVTDTRDELRRADAKAAQWLAALGAAMTAMLASWAARGSTPWQGGALPAWTASFGTTAAVVAVVALVLVLFPRTSGSGDLRHVAYFGHVSRIGDPDRVRELVEQAAQDAMPGMVTELCWLSRIAVLKYRYAKLGAIFAPLAVVLMMAASL
ncbi:Pycsar system effector family protein [Actinoplanes sp. TFC3]|uniref:Pycsar system effector family protein n=1 Tax=Actinoplanes sp. TFC3 TaxID=1710355 RepID=UPI000829701B|nr:Pycsar system effector family protein [Actinoplanes sp. TFC3]